MRAEDLLECLNFRPERIGAGIVGWDQAVDNWTRLLKSGLLLGAVVVAETGAKKEILGFGASVFVSRAFAEREIRDPRPGLNDRLMASMGTADSFVLTEAEIAAGNAGTGNCSVILRVDWRRSMAPKLFQRFAKEVSDGYERLHMGYQFASILIEPIGVEEIGAHMSSGAVRIIAEFAPDHVLGIIDSNSASQVISSVANRIVDYHHPIFRFTRAEQRLLLAALDGAPDAEIAKRIGGKADTHRKRWKDILLKVEQVRPELFPPIKKQAAPKGEEKRGPQKRHRLLPYLKEHMEELRPYRWPD